jgi:FkbM family methyltransferase
MAEYRRNKIRTAWQIVRKIENWPTVLAMRMNQRRGGLRTLNFRDGLTLLCRSGTREWDVIHELIFAGGYGRALSYLKEQSGRPVVLDLGGNIGVFSLLAARQQPASLIHAYEPGPPNYRLFEMNCLANPGLAENIQLHKEAVAGQNRRAQWFFDNANPGGSGLYGNGAAGQEVQIRSFAEIVAELGTEIALVKIDIEGAEYELLAGSGPETWAKIRAVSLELHHDPAGKISQTNFLDRMREYGFQIEAEKVCSFFLHRQP